VRRALSHGIELDDDPARVDVDAVHDYLANESYWAEGRPRETVERLVHESSRVVGLYDADRQIGFARAFTDGVAAVYLADVYVLSEYQGRGLGLELVRETIEGSRWTDLKWLLHTKDAHGLYRKLGFAEPDERVMERLPRA
jgi:GNAT superfamily N-acetyltransferase